MIGGTVPLAMGIFFLAMSFGDWDWFMNNTGPILIRLLGRDGARGFFALVGLFLIGICIFLIVIG